MELGQRTLFLDICIHQRRKGGQRDTLMIAMKRTTKLDFNMWVNRGLFCKLYNDGEISTCG